MNLYATQHMYHKTLLTPLLKKHLGLYDINQCILDVKWCISEAKLIYETTEQMSQAEVDS